MKQQIIFDKNNIQELKSFIKNYNIKDILLIRGKQSYEISGAKNLIEDTLKLKNIDSFFDFNINPDFNDLKKAINFYKRKNYKLIIAIGGGSVIDMAKLISNLSFANQNNLADIIKYNTVIEKKTPLLAIPTTSGTGAEATHFAVLYIDKKKYSFANKNILPEYIYFDYTLTESANTYLKACAGLDALSQAIESVWSVNANDESLQYALKSIELSINNIYKAVIKNNKQALENMQKAAYLAGKAINISKTTAPHAISYGFTSFYNIPHGHAVSLSLPYFFKYNYFVNINDCTDEKGVKNVRKRIDKILNIFNCEINNIENYLTNIYKQLNVNINISELIPNLNKELILNSINIQRLNNNPRKVTKESLIKFLNSN